jgi:hypothetical protein
MPLSRKPSLLASVFLLVISRSFAAAESPQQMSARDLAQRQITVYLAKLADLHCDEWVIQEKFASNGHVQATEHAKYDYLVMIDGNDSDLQLNESRIESAASHHKPLPMLVTNGFSTVLLVFHPYYRDSFTFEVGPDRIMGGRSVVPVSFAQIRGRRSPAALALRGREYPLELKGTAWLDRQSGEVIRMDAALLHDMSDVGLRSLTVHVEYKPTRLGSSPTPIALPALAVVDVTTPRQHWRNTHTFDSYRTFSIDAEQDSKVKVHAQIAKPNKDDASSTVPESAKETP